MGLFQYGVLGLGTGAILALLGLGLVVIYRGAGIVNLGHGAYAMFAAYLCWQLETGHVAPALAIPIAVIATAVLGFLTDQVILRRLRSASALARLIATAGMLLLIQSAVSIIWGVLPKSVNTILPQGAIHLSGVALPTDRLWLLLLVVLLGGSVALIWRYTRLGWIAEAVSESPQLARSFGWSTELTSGLTWALGTGLAGLAGVLVAPITQLDTVAMPSLIVPTLAAALVGRFRSFTLMFVGALVIGILQSEIARYVHITGAPDALPLLVIILVTVVTGTALPVRGYVSDRLPRVGSGVIRWQFALPAAIGIVILLSVLHSADWLTALTSSFAVATILLSFVVVVGYTGQVSLAQLTLAGAGGLIAARLSAYTGLPFIVALVAGGAGAAVVGILVGLPALRTRGISLTIVTLALAVGAQSMAFNGALGGSIEGILLPNINLFGLNINPVTHPQRYAITAFLVMGLLALFTAWLRRTALGRTLLAVRGNERAAAASGINLAIGKVFGFALGGAIAGIGGVLLAFSQPVATFGGYDPISGLNYLVEAVIGGVGFIGGALFGSTLSTASLGSLISLHWQSVDLYIPLIGAAALLATLVTNPDGWAYQVSRFVRSKLPMRIRADAGNQSITALSSTPPAAMGAELTLEVRDISVSYGGVHAVDKVSLTVRPGRVLGLIGPNGAGKTSLMDAVTGFARASHGTVIAGGRDITHEPAHRRARLGVSRSFQGLELYPDMSVAEHVLTAADGHRVSDLLTSLVSRGGSIPENVAQILRDFELWEHRDQLPDELPYGRRRLLGVARAMAAGGRALLIDEPVAGLDDVESEEFARVIRRLAKERRVAVLVIEHAMPFVMSVCDSICVLDFGRPVASGTPDEVKKNRAAIAAYLGEDEARAADAVGPV